MDIKLEQNPEKKKTIIEGMTDEEYDKYEKFLENSTQLGIKLKEQKLIAQQEVIKEGEKIDAITQEVIE